MTTCLVTFRPRIPHSTPSRNNQKFTAMQATRRSRALMVNRNLDFAISIIMDAEPPSGKSRTPNPRPIHDLGGDSPAAVPPPKI